VTTPRSSIPVVARVGSRVRITTACLVTCAVVLITSAGACNPSDGGPIPRPAEVTDASFVANASTTGLDALYAGRQRPECTELFRLLPDGTAHHESVCVDDVTPYLDDPSRWMGNSTGDYAYRDGLLWVRTVTWNPIVGEHELAEWTFRICATGLRDIPLADAFRVPFVYDLVQGAGPARCRSLPDRLSGRGGDPVSMTRTR
jgi:hypothetical protein